MEAEQATSRNTGAGISFDAQIQKYKYTNTQIDKLINIQIRKYKEQATSHKTGAGISFDAYLPNDHYRSYLQEVSFKDPF